MARSPQLWSSSGYRIEPAIDRPLFASDLECVRVGIEPGHDLDPGLLRRQPDRGSDQPGADDRESLEGH